MTLIKHTYINMHPTQADTTIANIQKSKVIKNKVKEKQKRFIFQTYIYVIKIIYII